MKIRGLFLWGTLENADRLSKVNRTLSNNLNVKRTPIGSSALGWYIEAGYDILSFFRQQNNSAKDNDLKDTFPDMVLDIFARYDYYDTMASVEELSLTIRGGKEAHGLSVLTTTSTQRWFSRATIPSDG